MSDKFERGHRQYLRNYIDARNADPPIRRIDSRTRRNEVIKDQCILDITEDNE